MNDYEHELYKEAEKEYRDNDPVIRKITKVSFVSTSKGRRNGKQRKRNHLKEVDLIKYQDGRFISEHRFPFDVYATEILGTSVPDDKAEEVLRERVKEL